MDRQAGQRANHDFRSSLSGHRTGREAEHAEAKNADVKPREITCRLQGRSNGGGRAARRAGHLQRQRFWKPHNARAGEQQAVRTEPAQRLAALSQPGMAVLHAMAALRWKATQTAIARAARGHDRPDHAVADGQWLSIDRLWSLCLAVCPDRHHASGNFMAQHGGHGDLSPASERMQITPAERAAEHLHEQLTSVERWRIDLLQPQFSRPLKHGQRDRRSWIRHTFSTFR